MKQFLKVCSWILVVVLMIHMLPTGVIAQELNAQTSEVSEGTTPEETTQPRILEEITQERTEYSKQFRLSNGLQMAVLYPDAVHYEKDGSWEEIDNTLTAQNGSYTNGEGVWNVRFPQQLSSSQSVVIEKDGYTLSFAMAGELNNTGLEIAGTVDSPELTVSAAAETVPETTAETVPETVPETTVETVPQTISEAANAATEQITVGNEIFSVSGMQLSNAAVIAVDADEIVQSADYPQVIAANNHSRLRYQNAFSNTDLLYDLQANTVKESIILNSYNAQLRGYRYALNVGQLVPVLLEDGQIDFYDADRETIVMSMLAPYMVDAAGEYCDDIQVRLTGQGSSYILTYILPQSWLADSSRAWPVTVDPTISADLSNANIRDRTVSENGTHAQNWMLNSCGYHSTYGIQRFYIKYRDLPALTASDVVIDAKIYMTKYETSSLNATIQVHKVLGTWESESITWANKPGFNETVEDYNIVRDVASIPGRSPILPGTGMPTKIQA